VPLCRAISLNRNKISSLLGFIGFATMKFPNITFLSLMGNKCCFSELTDSTVEQVAAYREKLILALPQVGGRVWRRTFRANAG